MRKGTREDPLILPSKEYRRLIQSGLAYLYVKIPHPYDAERRVFLQGKLEAPWTQEEVRMLCPLNGKGDEFWARRYGNVYGKLMPIHYEDVHVVENGPGNWHWMMRFSHGKGSQ